MNFSKNINLFSTIFYIQQDLDKYHIAALCKKQFQGNHIPLLEWIEDSPDFKLK